MTARRTLLALALLHASLARAAGPELAWRYRGGARMDAAPAATATAVAFTARSTLTLLDAAGNRQWTAAMADGTNGPASFDAPPAFTGGRVVLASRRGHVTALDAATGRILWQYEAGAGIRAAPLPAPGTNRLYVLTESSAVHCLDAERGTPLWRTEEGGRCESAPALAAGRVVFGNCDAALFVFDAASGNSLGKFPLGDDAQIASGMLTEGTRVVTGSRGGAIFAVDVLSGKTAWVNRDSTAETFTTPALGKDFIVAGSSDGHVYAVNAADGRPLWKCDVTDSPSSPLVLGSAVYVTARGSLIRIGASTGAVDWKLRIADDLSAPVACGEQVVVAADDGTVSAYRAAIVEEKSHE